MTRSHEAARTLSNPGAFSLCLAALLATPAGAGATPPPTDACELLADAEVRAVQERTVAGRIASTQESTAFRVLQCVYRTEDLAGSVSLALAVPRAETPQGARRYWETRFHPPAGAGRGTEQPPRPVPDLGDEAFWVGDAMTGSLYVLAGDGFLRISVGGTRDEAVREERAQTLAERALARVVDVAGAAGAPR